MQPDTAKSFLPVKHWKISYQDGDYINLDKRNFIDFTSGIFVANLGHLNTAVYRAIRDAAVTHGLDSYNYPTDIREKYTEALCRKTGFECVALFSAGCEAVEAALRVMETQRGSDYGFFYRTPGIFMHGKTKGARLSHSLALEENKMPDYLPETIKGIILESYRGWDAHFWDKKWIQDLRAYCTEHDILLCFDEIQSGFGRTGRFFCYEHYGIQPDLICIGKAMGAGIPLSGLLGSKDLLDNPGDLSSTHSGNPLACAAGLAVISEMERLDLVKEAERKGNELHVKIELMGYPYPVHGKGMVAAIIMPSVEEANRVVMECYKRGLLVVHTGRESVKIGPPLVISDEALIKGLDIIEKVLNG